MQAFGCLRHGLDETIYCLGSFGGVLDMKDVIEDIERAENEMPGSARYSYLNATVGSTCVARRAGM